MPGAASGASSAVQSPGYNPNQQAYIEQTTVTQGPNGEVITSATRGGGALGTLNSLLGSGGKTSGGGHGGQNNLLNVGMSLLGNKPNKTGGSHGSATSTSNLMNMGMSLLGGKPAKSPATSPGAHGTSGHGAGGAAGLMGYVLDVT